MEDSGKHFSRNSAYVTSRVILFLFQSVVDPTLPFYILAFGAVIGGVIALFLPETAGIDLPDTIEEAEEFRKDQHFFLVPFMEEKRRKRAEKSHAVTE